MTSTNADQKLTWRLHPDSTDEVLRSLPQLTARIGPALEARLRDSQIRRALRDRPFYRQDFHDSFQFESRDVMFAYQTRADADLTIIRFPQLADAIQFVPVQDLHSAMFDSQPGCALTRISANGEPGSDVRAAARLCIAQQTVVC
jgi:hypothetical protein